MQKQLEVTQDFTDKQGQQRKKGEKITVQNDQEAQEYIRQGNAKEAGQGQQGQEHR